MDKHSNNNLPINEEINTTEIKVGFENIVKDDFIQKFLRFELTTAMGNTDIDFGKRDFILKLLRKTIIKRID